MNNKFSNDYFDSGIKKLGQYTSYDAEKFYPAFVAMSKEINKLLSCKKILDIGSQKAFLLMN